MELKLTGKRVLITGASIGLGLYFAHILARSGAEVTLAVHEVLAKFKKLQKSSVRNGYGAEALETRCDK